MISIAIDAAEPPATTLEALRVALGDPSLQLVYWRSGVGTWIDDLGLPVPALVTGKGRVLTPLERDRDWVAGLIHNEALLTDPERIRAACNRFACEIDEERLRASLRAQVRDEQASRTRILEASDRQRRRLERNLHDGAQQRLVGLALVLRLAAKRAEGDSSVTDLLTEAAGELDDAIDDLRTLARGLHPAIVSDAGFAVAVEALAEHPGIPVNLTIDLPERLPDHVQVAGYYLVAEALANANKHSGATWIAVRAWIDTGVFCVSVNDDGTGGATATGSGLVGLDDRLGALGGRLEIASEPGHGTTVTGYVPLEATTPTADHRVDDILLRIVPEDQAVGPYAPGTARHARWLQGDMDRRRRALKWIAWQMFAAPGEVIEAQDESEDLFHAKVMLLMTGGNRNISQQRRDWILGYLTAAGYSENVLAAAAAYDDSDSLQELLSDPRIALAQLVQLHDALRACAFDNDGPISADAFDPVLRAADEIGIPREVVADLHAIVLDEHRLRQRRHELIVATAMPKLLNDSIAITKDESPDQE